MTQLRGVTCHMGSHSVTFYPTQVNTPCLHPSQTGWYSIYRQFKGGELSKPRPRVQRATERSVAGRLPYDKYGCVGYI